MSTRKDALALLKADHAKVKELFAQFEEYAKKGKPSKTGQELADQIMHELTVHASIEERLFYPVVRKALGTKESEKMVFEAYEEHHLVKAIITELASLDIGAERFNAKMQVLTEMVLHHAEEEETDLFPKVKKACSAEFLEALGSLLLKEKESAPKHPIAKEEKPMAPPSELMALLDK